MFWLLFALKSMVISNRPDMQVRAAGLESTAAKELAAALESQLAAKVAEGRSADDQHATAQTELQV